MSVLCSIQPTFIILERSSEHQSLLCDFSAVMFKAQSFLLVLNVGQIHVIKHSNPSSSFIVWYLNVSSSHNALGLVCVISKCFKNIVYIM